MRMHVFIKLLIHLFNMQFDDEYEERDPYYLDPVGIELKTFPSEYIRRNQTIAKTHLMKHDTISNIGTNIIRIKASFETIHRIVSDVFRSIECLKSHYDDCSWKWVMQYGTRTLSSLLTYKQRQYYELKSEIVEEMVKNIRLTFYMGVSPFYFSRKGIRNFDINEKSYWINQATAEALNRFPHLFDLDEFDFDIIPIGGGPRRWCEMSCEYFDNGDYIILKFYHNSIDRNSFYHVFNRLSDALFNKKNLLWVARSSYIRLLEGTLETDNLETDNLESDNLETDNLDQIVDWDHISRYFRNLYVCKEICTYLN